MKKHLLIFLFFTSISSFSQVINEYKINIFNLNYRITAGVKNSTTSKIRITINYENGSSENIYNRDINEEGDNEVNKNVFSEIRAKKPISVECYAFVNFRTGTDANSTVFADLDTFCPNGGFDGVYSPRITHITFDYKIEPKLIVYQNPDDSLPTDSDIIINSLPNFRSDYYKWQYKLNPSNPISPWIDLLQYDGQSSITTNATAIFGALAPFLHGNSIIFQQKVCNVNSNIVYHIIRNTAPKILSVQTTPVTCFKALDGKLKLFFDRQLLPEANGINNEKLNFSLSRMNEDGTTSTLPNILNVFINADKSVTIPDLSPGNYELKLNGDYNGFPTYSVTSTPNNGYKFTIAEPTPVQFTATATTINCAGGSDGTITITAKGGITYPIRSSYKYSLDNGSTWKSFSDSRINTEIITNLAPKSYDVKVKDFNGCIAKIPTATNTSGIVTAVSDLDKTVSVSTVQTQPSVNVDYSFHKEPTYFGGKNGILVASVTGGNPFADGHYEYLWTDSVLNAVPQANTTATIEAGGVYKISLNNIPAGKYYLTVKDKNYATATVNQTPTVNQNAGCSNANTEYELKQPEPITVILKVKQEISCNTTNEFGNETNSNPNDNQRDESQDGIIEAQVNGGVVFTGNQNNGNRYVFSWKKKDATGFWQPFVGETATIQNLSQGEYALNVKDANGIELGTFDVYGVFTKIDATLPLVQPLKLEVTIDKTDVNCFVSNSGEAIATPIGGTPPYTYVWTDAKETNLATAKNLVARNYLVTVTDSKKCTVQGSVTINQPKGVVITATTLKSPSCTDGTTGAKGEIILKVTTQENETDISGLCTYSWNTKPVQTTKDIKDLLAGDYTVTVTDQTQCVYKQNFSLQNPAPIKVDLGPDRTLCNAQEHELDITIKDPKAQYVWTSTTGFVSSKPKVKLNQAGVYYAKVISSLGCIGEDQITISSSNVAIASEFLVSSQAYVGDEIVVVNSSNPFGENTEWVIPAEVEMVEKREKYMVIKCNTVGTYAIALKQTQGDCYALYPKNINVEAKTATNEAGKTSNQFIKEFTVTPNPTTGQFQAIIKLNEVSAVHLRLYSETGQKTNLVKTEKGSKNYVIDFDATNLANQTYILILETAKQTLVKKIIKI